MDSYCWFCNYQLPNLKGTITEFRPTRSFANCNAAYFLQHISMASITREGRCQIISWKENKIHVVLWPYYLMAVIPNTTPKPTFFKLLSIWLILPLSDRWTFTRGHSERYMPHYILESNYQDSLSWLHFSCKMEFAKEIFHNF